MPEILHIDLHSGYGPVGGATILPADDLSEANIARAKAWWGDRLEYTPSDGPATALANVSGPIECSFPLYMPAANTLSVTVETGTIPFPQVLSTLVRDHQRVAAGEGISPASISRMRAAYAPRDTDLQHNVVESFTRILREGLAGMAAEKGPSSSGRLAAQGSRPQ